jgi:hypothetical protein
VEPPAGTFQEDEMFAWLLRLFTRRIEYRVAPVDKPALSPETRSRLLAVGMAAAERRSALL